MTTSPADANPYPVTYQSDSAERRSRLAVFFRIVLVIPHQIVLSVLGFFALFAVVIAWFALLFTGRWPRGLYDFVAGVLRYGARVTGYVHLLTDAYPPFSLGEHDDYPVRLGIPAPQDSYSRLKVLFRALLAIPVLIISYALNIVAWIGAFLAWFAILFTGRLPEGLKSMIDLGVAYLLRAGSYYLLITEDWPPFSADD